MSIVSSIVWKVRDRGNGRIAVFEKHTDHTGEVHEHRYSAPVEHDTRPALSNWAVELNAVLVSQEKAEVIASITGGADPYKVAVKHLTEVQKAKQIIKALMLGKPYKMLKTAKYVKSFTDAQIERHYSKKQCIRIRAMQNYVLNNQAVFNTDLREEL